MRERDTRIMRLAARQFGAFAGEQAVRVGYPRSTIRARARSGVWERLHRDTYRVTGAEVPWQQPLVSAWLSVGGPAAISGRAAASLWGLGVDPPGRPEILVPLARRVERPGVRIKRTRRWAERDVVRLGSLQVTAVPRTLLDLARGPDEVILEIAPDIAHRRGLVDLERLDSYLAEAVPRKVRGATRLRELAALRNPNRPIESELETILFRVLRLGRVPLPEPQHWIHTRSGWRRIDFAHPAKRFAIEVDGYGPRDSRLRFDDDRARDNELAEHGWERRHITWTMLMESPLDVLWTIATGLGLEPARWRPARGRR